MQVGLGRLHPPRLARESLVPVISVTSVEPSHREADNGPPRETRHPTTGALTPSSSDVQPVSHDRQRSKLERTIPVRGAVFSPPAGTTDSRPPVTSTGVIFDVAIAVTLKPVVNDPQGLVVHSGLQQLGFDRVSDVRVGKYIQLRLEAADEDAARVQATQMCEQLLRNPVIEDYRIGLEMQLETAQ